MALNWKWDMKCGELTLVQEHDGKKYEHILSLYQGNAYLIMLNEDSENNTYEMFSFWVDKPHAKRCLGLVKGSANVYYGDFTKLKINKSKCRKADEIVSLFVKACDNITIEVYTKESEE